MRLADIPPLAAIVFAAAWLSPLPKAFHGSELYVSPEGADWKTGASRRSAVRTIQRAADLAGPGDTVVILPGVYPEWVRIRNDGRAGEPITFRADVAGSVTITGTSPAEPGGGLAWKAEGGGLYSAAPPWPVYRIKSGKRILLNMRWGGVSNLVHLCSRPGAQGAFATVNERLYLYLENGVDPASTPLVLNRKTARPGLWGFWRAANLWVEADHVVLEGLRMQDGLGAAVRVWDSSHVIVRHCLMSGAQSGVAGAGLQDDAAVVVEHCLYHNNGQRQWRDGWLSKAEAYAFQAGRLVGPGGSNVRIKHNLVVSSHDGIAVSPRHEADAGWMEVAYNLIAGCIDDALEADGQAHRLWFHHNLVYDCHQSLGLSPVLRGPVVIENNRFLHPARGINQSNVKLLNPWRDKGGALSRPIRNVLLRDNLFVGKWLCWHNGSRTRDLDVSRNVFAMGAAQDRPWPPGVRDAGNGYVDLSGVDYPDPGESLDWLRPRIADAARDRAQIRPESINPGWRIPRPGPDWYDWGEPELTATLWRKLNGAGYLN